MKLNCILASVWIILSACLNYANAQTDPPEGCDYSDSINHFGWGWNPSTLMSCEPDQEMTLAEFVTLYEALDTNASYEEIIEQLRVDYCDYSNSEGLDGWGWNNVLSESCAPIKAGSPEIVTNLTFPEREFILHMTISSNSILYSFEPSYGLFSATTITGEPIWRVSVANIFINDIQLNDNEDLLITSSLTSETIAFNLDGTVAWRVKGENTIGPPTISQGDSAIIAYYKDNQGSNIEIIESYNYDGSIRWRYKPDSSIEDVTLGNDGLVYLELPWGSTEAARYVVLKQ